MRNSGKMLAGPGIHSGFRLYTSQSCADPRFGSTNPFAFNLSSNVRLIVPSASAAVSNKTLVIPFASLHADPSSYSSFSIPHPDLSALISPIPTNLLTLFVHQPHARLPEYQPAGGLGAFGQGAMVIQRPVGEASGAVDVAGD